MAYEERAADAVPNELRAAILTVLIPLLCIALYVCGSAQDAVARGLTRPGGDVDGHAALWLGACLALGPLLPIASLVPWRRSDRAVVPTGAVVAIALGSAVVLAAVSPFALVWDPPPAAFGSVRWLAWLGANTSFTFGPCLLLVGALIAVIARLVRRARIRSGILVVGALMTMAVPMAAVALVWG
ncbi:hypothetical protein [Curtobacterium sp. 9128]|uniref:hypothetical protein n=1 Tax=Curtobacterium sp. 9128 TaxID=1793722 RepID=UPI0011AAE38C|nr:hypothetical protein [Curtobacterium sp. 9128]